MSRFKQIFFKGVNVFNLNWLKKASPVNVIIPFHHLVSDAPVPYIEPLYRFKNTQQFERDIDFLLKNFTPVTLTDLIAAAKQERPLPKKSFLITFDDALKQVYEVAMPILQRKGVPASLFIVPDFLDNKLLFYDLKKGLILDHLLKHTLSAPTLQQAAALTNQTLANKNVLIEFVRSINYLNRDLTDKLGELLNIDFEGFLEKEKPFMSTQEVKNFIAKGFEVGAHSLDHPLYRLIPLEEQIRQTEASLKWVAETFDLPYKVFAFTHVDKGVSQEFFDHMFNKADTVPDLILGNTTGKLEHHPRVLHRFIGENPLVPIEAMVKSVLLYSTVNKLTGNQFVKRA